MSKRKTDPISWYREEDDLDRPLLVQSLLARLHVHSPEIVLGVQRYLAESGQLLDERRPYDGTDASARLFLLLMEGLLTFEQLRYEVRDQVGQHQRAHEGQVPSNLLLAMGNLIELEAEMIQASKIAWETHLAVWNAHAVPTMPREPDDLTDARGRWVSKEDDE